MAKRKEEFGVNTYPEKPFKSFWVFVWEAAQDTTLIILMVCAALSLTFGLIAEGTKEGWYDGVAIGLAVILVILVTAFSDYRQSLQFRGLDAEKQNIQLKVLRGGRMQTVSIFTLVVGDVVPLAIGDQVPGDGLLVEGHSLTIDEASMTGESDPMHKDAKRPYLLSGCKVLDGYGTMVITAVGTNTEWGRVMATINNDEDSETPLQVRLNGLATSIGKLGLVVAVLVFIVLIIRYAVTYVPGKSVTQVFKDIVDNFSIAVTIIVVAVPEGLPLAVTLTLAYSMGKMMMDKALVRHLAACETMGSATTICSDKTGTLTLNQMTAVRAWHGGTLHADSSAVGMSEQVKKAICEGVALNSTGSVFVPADGSPPEVSGSPTESAIISWALSELALDYNGLRHEDTILAVETFNSAKKRAGVAVRRPSGDAFVHWKGAAEIILANCATWMDADGSAQELTDAKREEVLDAIATMAANSLRCIALGCAPVEPSTIPAETEGWKFPETGLSLIGIVGIKDPCRPGVPDAVARCQKAGVKVRMVTGDNVLTARAIASECGILTPTGTVIEGKDFRVMTKEQMLAVIPNLDVMARSSPTDKHLLVKMLRSQAEVVAVTGDGTNDAPALHEADIGLSMGIAGTEVAKESSDIVILDDNFTSIVKVVRWGRSVFANIQKFIQFQLTVNIAALVINFIAACTDGHVPLNAVQLLWVNLIMDTLGALALATEPPTDELLEQKPVGRKAPLITNIMWRNILIQSAYQVVVLMTLNYCGVDWFNLENDADPKRTNNTIIFNAFVFCQLFNEVNARKPDKFNVFEGLHRNHLFILVLALSTGFQVIVIELLHNFAKTVSLTWSQWLITIGIGSVSWPLAFIGKFIPVAQTPMLDFLKTWRAPKFMRRQKSTRSRAASFKESASTASAAATAANAAAEEDGAYEEASSTKALVSGSGNGSENGSAVGGKV
eukprot:TRINITY_DN10839_c0_g1_i4.p1 TRINITY_DN10839_c0_g1~~TRINITY_DN10839_c0_g1_i4.p1  ORF type:complete len:975 (+),score=140.04 TRINITY_DN10839_c0_g1_i4:69-2927(+)